MKYRVNDVIKNINVLKEQTEVMKNINLRNDENKQLQLAIEDLAVTVFSYLKGD